MSTDRFPLSTEEGVALPNDGNRFALPLRATGKTDGPIGGFVVFSSSQRPGAHPHPGGGFLLGFSNRCTHMGCSLLRERSASEGEFDTFQTSGSGDDEAIVVGPCPCHGTSFDLTKGGLVILGPATANLPPMKLDDGSNGEIVASGWADDDPDPFGEDWGESSSDFLTFLNNEPSAKLQEINGIGPDRANAIIAGRPWPAVAALASIPGISEAMLETFGQQLEGEE